MTWREMAAVTLVLSLLICCGRREPAAPAVTSPQAPAVPEPRPVGKKTIEPDTVITVPVFANGTVPSIFTDITYIALNKQLMAANQVGLGEFPLRANGDINFDQAFVAPCKDCHMRGFTEIGSGLVTALLWERRVLSVSESRQKSIDYKLPPEITDASGLARLGKVYLVSDRAARQVFVLELVPADTTTRIVKRIDCAGSGVEGVTVRDRAMWTTDGQSLYEYENDVPVRAFQLPSPISGFCFAGRFMYAAAKDKPEIYRYLSPAGRTEEARNPKPEIQNNSQSE